MEKMMASEYVARMQHTLGLELSNAERSAYVAATDMVMENWQVPFNVRDIHHVMFAGGKDAGRFRSACVIGVNGQCRNLPPYTRVEFLMGRFSCAYHRTLAGIFDEYDVVDVAWSIAALGRFIHPFVFGNIRTFHLIENQLRQNFGLPWRCDLEPKRRFTDLRIKASQSAFMNF